MSSSTPAVGSRKRKRGGSRWKSNTVSAFAASEPSQAVDATEAPKPRPQQQQEQEQEQEEEEETCIDGLLTRQRFAQEWCRWPRQGSTLAGTMLLPIKCPLGAAFDEFVPELHRFSADMFVRCQRSRGVHIGMLLQVRHCTAKSHLTAIPFWEDFASNEYRDMLQKLDVTLVTLEVGRKSIVPSEEETAAFVKLVASYTEKHPGNHIAVQDTSSMNLCGFLMAVFLIEHTNSSVEVALERVAASRPPGIYHRSWLRELFLRYDDDDPQEADAFLQRRVLNPPQWDRRNQEPTASLSRSWLQELQALGAVSVKPPHLERLQKKCQTMCQNDSIFIGLSRAAFSRVDLDSLSVSEWMVSWRTKSSRRLLLLVLREGCFALLPTPNLRTADVKAVSASDCRVLHLPGMRFPRRKHPKSRVDQTLIEGELVMDRVSTQDNNNSNNEEKIARLLITDVLVFEGHSIAKHPLRNRLHCANLELVQPMQTLSSKPPLRVRVKKMFALEQCSTIFDTVMPTLPHAHEGLEFVRQGPHPIIPGSLPVSCCDWIEQQSAITKQELLDKIANLHNVFHSSGKRHITPLPDK